MVTMSDWTLAFGTWEKYGVRTIFERFKEAGMKRVYWRVFDGGQANYHSKIADIGSCYACEKSYYTDAMKWSRERIEQDGHVSFKSWDPLKDAVAYARKSGMEIYAWWPVNEDDHAWGVLSRFAKENPQFLRCYRNGEKFRSNLSWAYKESVDYKLSLLREFMAYGLDGVLLDFPREGDVRDIHIDEAGYCLEGYEPPIRKSFQDKYCLDPLKIPNSHPDWIRHRADYSTRFISTLRKELKRIAPKAKMGLHFEGAGNHRWALKDTGKGTYQNVWRFMQKGPDYLLNGKLLDLKTIADQGAVDFLCPQHRLIRAPNSGTFKDNEFKWMRDFQRIIKEQLTLTRKIAGAKMPLHLYTPVYQKITRGSLGKNAKAAFQGGVEDMLLWESTPLMSHSRIEPWKIIAELNEKYDKR